jgi:hypothetical protein
MKNLILISGLLFIVPSLSSGQTVGDSTRRQERQRVHRLIDENGDGINDRVMGQRRMGRQGADKFIDANGDGICDGREGGIGFRRGQSRGITEPDAQVGRKGQKGK